MFGLLYQNLFLLESRKEQKPCAKAGATLKVARVKQKCQEPQTSLLGLLPDRALGMLGSR